MESKGRASLTHSNNVALARDVMIGTRLGRSDAQPEPPHHDLQTREAVALSLRKIFSPEPMNKVVLSLKCAIYIEADVFTNK